ncbi:hypothetical protein [Endozoicomonas sp. 4G]|uniref:hypothetical protein n=1 Tax=Endozoicomonas sp. 4G TaxID=2872754 RepID=UPI00207919F4|nr:hypothetical protein [Endozoicomonas sp. 4G]
MSMQRHLQSMLMRAGRRHNDIGTPGAWGFGVGVTPYDRVPAGWEPAADHTTPDADGYGNYTYLDGSVAAYVPAFYYKWGTGSNGLSINTIDIKNIWTFRDRAHAAQSGYALHRAFVDGGQVMPGAFVDKYQWSANSYNGNVVAGSIKNGDPLSSSASRNGWGSLLTGLTTTDNIYAGALKAAKTRGQDFFCNSRFIWAALAMLSYAHAQASSSTERCGWYMAGANYPKGNNSNNAARTDVDDTSCSWTSKRLQLLRPDGQRVDIRKIHAQRSKLGHCRSERQRLGSHARIHEQRLPFPHFQRGRIDRRCDGRHDPVYGSVERSRVFGPSRQSRRHL